MVARVFIIKSPNMSNKFTITCIAKAVKNDNESRRVVTKKGWILAFEN